MGFRAAALVYRISIHELSVLLPRVLNPDNPLHVQEYPPGFHWLHQCPCLHLLVNWRNLPIKSSSSEFSTERSWCSPCFTSVAALPAPSCPTTSYNYSERTGQDGHFSLLFKHGLNKPCLNNKEKILFLLFKRKINPFFPFNKPLKV